MTVTMYLASRLLPRKRQPLLEPGQITDLALSRSRVHGSSAVDEMPDKVQLAAHFAFGGGVGAVYPIIEPYIPLPEKYRGPAFGLSVYAASYAAWIPSLDILPPPQRRPIGRNLLLIAAHIVWGASLGLTYRALQRKSEQRIVQARLSGSDAWRSRHAPMRNQKMQRAS
jgi:uncharacterized membrane protein YagU involved in acid resistance